MRKLASACAIAATTVLLLETVLRVWNPVPARWRGDRVGLQPGAHIIVQNPVDPKLDRVVTQDRNALGFRGPDVPADFSHRLSIVAVGGSTTECMLLPDEKTWPAVMAAQLARTRPNVWVNNAGVDGMTTVGHKAMLEERLIPLHPKIILYLTGTNDVDYNPLWTSRAADAWRYVARYSEVASVSLNLVRAWRARPLNYEIEEGTIDLLHSRHKKATEQDIQALIAAHGAQLRGYRERLEALVERTRQAGIQPVLITQPMLPGEVVDPATGVDMSTVVETGGLDRNGAESWRLLDRFNDETRAIAATNDIALIDLAKLLPKDSRLFIDFVHYSNEGAAVVGRIIASELAARFAADDSV